MAVDKSKGIQYRYIGNDDGSNLTRRKITIYRIPNAFITLMPHSKECFHGKRL